LEIRFIGDVHGKFSQYLDIILPDQIQNSVQVGDMGVGFHNVTHNTMSTHPHIHMKNGNHRFIRGNHDNPAFCRDPEHSKGMWIPDGKIENNIMYVGGATSIDKAWRTESVDWWPDEQLSYNDLNVMIDTYMIAKPEIMITHECPDFIADVMLAKYNRRKFEETSATRQALQAMFQMHKPKLWIFGHWHMNEDFEFGRPGHASKHGKGQKETPSEEI
jgi:hypothetical protein